MMSQRRGFPPPRPHKVLRLYSQWPHLSVLCALLYILHQLLLLVLELDALSVEFPLRFLEGTLVLAQPLGWRHALAKGPFHDLQTVSGAPPRLRMDTDIHDGGEDWLCQGEGNYISGAVRVVRLQLRGGWR